MIKSISIQNFQSHEETSLKFHSGVNIIHGSSDSGKSAIIRAIRWLVWNRPSGESMRSYWGGRTRVEIQTEDGDVVRDKDKTDHYQVYRSGEALDLTSFGTTVPEEVNKLLNLTEINLQRQLDSHFLLSKTPGEVAQHFNKVARLDKIDSSTQNVTKWVNELSSTIGKEATKDKPATGLIKQIKDAEEELKLYEHLEEFEAEVETLEQLSISLNLKRKNKQKLETLVQAIKDKNREIEEASSLLTLEEEVDQLLELYKKRNYIENCKNKLSKHVSSIRRVSVLLKTEETKLSVLQTRFEREFPDVCPLCGKPK